MVKVQFAVKPTAPSLQHVQHIPPVERLADKAAGRPVGGELGQGRHHVDARQWHADFSAAAYAAAWPTDGRRHADAALPHVELVATQRPVVVGDRRHAAVVAEEPNQRVVRLARVVDRAENPADAVIHARHHRRHLLPQISVFAPRVFPGQMGEFFQLFFRCLKRRVRRVERHIAEIRRGALRVLCDKPAGRAGDQVGGVSLLAAGLFVEVPVALALAGQCKIVDRAVVMAVKMREPLIVRVPFRVVVAEVPFAKHATVPVARLGQRLRQRDLGGIQAKMPPWRNDRPRHPKPDWVAAGHQPGARWAAHREHVKTIQFHPLTGDPIKMRRRDAVRVEADVGPAQVVGHDDNDVGLRFRRGGGRLGQGQRRNRKQKSGNKNANHETVELNCAQHPTAAPGLQAVRRLAKRLAA